MARRRGSEEELPFSLDSFLDIVANLVGILIRLIVMVGLTIRALPTDAAKRQEAEDARRAAEYAERRADWESQKQAIDAENAKRTQAGAAALQERDRELQRRRQALSERAAAQKMLDDRSDERTRAIAERLLQLRDYERQAAERNAAAHDLARERDHESELFAKELDEARKAAAAVGEQTATLAELQAELRAAQQAVDAERLRRTTLDDELAELRKRFAELAALPKPTTTVKHYAAPLAERVEIAERHYRLLKGRIVATHLEEFVEQLGTKARAAATAARPQLSGKLGPRDGFFLQYRLEAAQPDFASRSRTDGRWEVQLERAWLVAESDELGELAAEAVGADSQFRRSLAGVDRRDTVLTLWIYPDSFGAAKEVEEFLHRQGFTVALRPMPAGAPIAVGPNGSASDAR